MKQKIEGGWVERFDDEIQKIRDEIEEQRRELIDMNDCDGNVCECETGYDVAETYQCKHCMSIVFDENKLRELISDLLASERQRCVGETIQSVLACVDEWAKHDEEDLDDLRGAIKEVTTV